MTPPPPRLPSDTIPCPTPAEIAHAVSHPRTPPPEIQAAIADAQGIEVEVCVVCGIGLVEPKLNARMKRALPMPPPPETLDALPDEEDTRP